MRQTTERQPSATSNPSQAAVRPDILVALALAVAVFSATVGACSETPPIAADGGGAGATGFAGAASVGSAGAQAVPDGGAAGAGTAGMAVGGDAGNMGGGAGSVLTGGSGVSGQQFYCGFDTNFTFTTPTGVLGSIDRSGPDWSIESGGIQCTSWHTFTYCGADGLDVYDLAQDVQDPDVQHALGIGIYAAVYGDPQAGHPWKFGRGPNEMMTVYVGTACASSTCNPIPAGITRLLSDLDQMVTALAAAPDCPI